MAGHDHADSKPSRPPLLDRSTATGVWLILLTLALILSAKFENDYRTRAHRLDLKVMTLELKGQSAIIDRMGRWRNETRATAERFEAAVLSFSAAAAFAGIALAAPGIWLVVMPLSALAAISGTGFGGWAFWAVG